MTEICRHVPYFSRLLIYEIIRFEVELIFHFNCLATVLILPFRNAFALPTPKLLEVRVRENFTVFVTP